jgi:RDD family
MSEVNPYATPMIEVTESEGVDAEQRLAERWERLNAAIIDGLLSICLAFPILYKLGFGSSFDPERPRSLVAAIAPALIGVVGLLLIHGYLLKRNGQTVGKYCHEAFFYGSSWSPGREASVPSPRALAGECRWTTRGHLPLGME